MHGRQRFAIWCRGLQNVPPGGLRAVLPLPLPIRFELRHDFQERVHRCWRRRRLLRTATAPYQHAHRERRYPSQHGKPRRRSALGRAGTRQEKCSTSASGAGCSVRAAPPGRFRTCELVGHGRDCTDLAVSDNLRLRQQEADRAQACPRPRRAAETRHLSTPLVAHQPFDVLRPLPFDTPLLFPVWFRPSGRPILGGIQG